MFSVILQPTFQDVRTSRLLVSPSGSIHDLYKIMHYTISISCPSYLTLLLVSGMREKFIQRPFYIIKGFGC